MMNKGQKRKCQICFIACLLVICALAPIQSYADHRTYEGSGWDTPEEAVMVYFEGLKEQDLGKMISAYAVETHVDHFDLQLQLERIRAYTTGMSQRMPNSTKLIREINIETRKNEIVQSILWQMTNICLYERAQDFDAPIVFTGENPAEETKAFVQELSQAFDAVNFGTLTVLRFVPPEEISEQYASKMNQENIKRQAELYGTDEVRSMIAVFTLDDYVGGLCCDVARYGDRWFMHKPVGNVAIILGLPYTSSGMIVGPVDVMAGVLAAVGLDLDIIVGDFGF